MLNNKTQTGTQALPSNKNFGLTFTGFFLVLGALQLFKQHYVAVVYLVLSSAIVASCTFIKPVWLTPFNKLWARFGSLLHSVMSPLMLGILFYVVFTPIGCVMRTFGWDPLRLKFDRTANTYWQNKADGAQTEASMRNQF